MLFAILCLSILQNNFFHGLNFEQHQQHNIIVLSTVYCQCRFVRPFSINAASVRCAHAMLATTVCLYECLELEFLFRHQFLFIDQQFMQSLCDSINFLAIEKC